MRALLLSCLLVLSACSAEAPVGETSAALSHDRAWAPLHGALSIGPDLCVSALLGGVRLQGCDGQAYQDWFYDWAPGLLRGWGGCLQNPGGDGHSVGMAACDGNPAQRWSYNLSTHRYQNVASSQCLTFFWQGYIANTDGWPTFGYFGLTSCDKNDDQWEGAVFPVQRFAFAFNRATPPYPHSIVGMNQKCFDVRGMVDANNVPLQVWDCGGTWNQQFSYDGATGYLRTAKGRCVEVDKLVNFQNGDPVDTRNCWGGVNQKWDIDLFGELQLRGTNKCLEIKDYDTDNGTPIWLWDCYVGANQTFNLNDI